MSEVVRVSVLGDFHVSLPDGRPAQFRTRRAAELVASLCLAGTRRLLRTELAADLWPDADRSTGLRNLRPALNYARAALENPDSIVANEDWLVLADNVETDWQEVTQLESRINQARGGDDRLVILYSLNELIQKPLLGSWDSEWMSNVRVYHDQRRLNSLRQLSEELGSRGEWRAALDFARRITELDPTSEDGIRLQLRYLGELERPMEAQREFSLYARNLKTNLGLSVNPSLRQFAENVVAGRFPRAGSRPLTAIQQEMIAEMMGVMVEEEPERLLPLLASPKLNWSLVFYGSEMRPILERALTSTNGWTKERCGVAKRLLQVYSQEHEWSKVVALAEDLYNSEDPTDKIASLNFRAFDRQEALDYPASLDLFDQAAKIAESVGEDYLHAVSVANRGILNVRFEVFKLGLQELHEAQDQLALRKEPNARFGTSQAKGWAIMAAVGQGNLEEGLRIAEDWRFFAETNGTLPYDSQGKLFYGMTLALTGTRGAREWLLTGIDAAFLSRDPNLLFDSVSSVVHSMAALKLTSEAALAAQEYRLIAKKQGKKIAPFSERLLGPASAAVAQGEKLVTVIEVLSYCREKLISSS